MPVWPGGERAVVEDVPRRQREETKRRRRKARKKLRRRLLKKQPSAFALTPYGDHNFGNLPQINVHGRDLGSDLSEVRSFVRSLRGRIRMLLGEPGNAKGLGSLLPPARRH